MNKLFKISIDYYQVKNIRLIFDAYSFIVQQNNGCFFKYHIFSDFAMIIMLDS